MNKHLRIKQIIRYFEETGDAIALGYLIKKFGKSGLAKLMHAYDINIITKSKNTKRK